MVIFKKVKFGAKEYTQPISNLSPVEFDEHQYIKEGENGQKNIKVNNYILEIIIQTMS